jgi:ribonucleotide monophosphatase NagD (HAD superfamily)
MLGTKNAKYKLTENEVIMSHTPYKELLSEYSDEFILIAGYGNVIENALSYGLGGISFNYFHTPIYIILYLK